MIRSISSLSASTEFLSVSDWDDMLRLPEDDLIPRLLAAKDPLANISFPGIEPIAIFGFVKNESSWSFGYFWADQIDQKYSIDWAEPSGELFDLITFGFRLAGYCDEEYTLGLLRCFFEENGDLIDWDAIGPDVHLYWCSYANVENVKFAALYRSRLKSDRFSAETIGQCINFHFDFFRLKSPVWERVPLGFLAGIAGRDEVLMAKILLQPKCFDPREKRKIPTQFLWPWQRSMKFPSTSGPLGYRAIKTTSLVFDIRKSTMVLEQLPNAERGRFPAFIRDLVKIAKSCVFRHGGFFDKETGDGIVAHFCRFDLGDAPPNDPSLRAFRAAREILQEIRGKCDEIQQPLNLGVGGLGGSVGLHSSEAVWSCDDGLISALGDSVIMAARLCAEAENFAIFSSNSEFYRIASDLSPSEVQNFEQREYLGKEWSPNAKLFGMMFQT